MAGRAGVSSSDGACYISWGKFDFISGAIAGLEIGSKSDYSVFFYSRITDEVITGFLQIFCSRGLLLVT